MQKLAAQAIVQMVAGDLDGGNILDPNWAERSPDFIAGCIGLAFVQIGRAFQVDGLGGVPGLNGMADGRECLFLGVGVIAEQDAVFLPHRIQQDLRLEREGDVDIGFAMGVAHRRAGQGRNLAHTVRHQLVAGRRKTRGDGAGARAPAGDLAARLGRGGVGLDEIMQRTLWRQARRGDGDIFRGRLGGGLRLGQGNARQQAKEHRQDARDAHATPKAELFREL
jgi:hypothetical protein